MMIQPSRYFAVLFAGVLAACAVEPYEDAAPPEALDEGAPAPDYDFEAWRSRGTGGSGRASAGGSRATGGSSEVQPSTGGGGASNVVQTEALCGPGVTTRSSLPAGYRLISGQVGGAPTYSYVLDPDAPASPLPPGVQLQCYTTSDGERFARFVAAPPTTIEAPIGARCGFVDSNGAVVQCAPGIVCAATAPGTVATCQPPVRPPVNPG